MNPDLIFLLGVVILLFALPATLSAFSSSDKTFRPVILSILAGGSLIVAAMSQSPQGYTVNDVPRIVMDLFR